MPGGAARAGAAGGDEFEGVGAVEGQRKVGGIGFDHGQPLILIGQVEAEGEAEAVGQSEAIVANSGERWIDCITVLVKSAFSAASPPPAWARARPGSAASAVVEAAAVTN